VWRHAHSDWFELLATTGLVGLGLVVAGCFFLVRRLWRQEEGAVRSEDHAGAVGALGAVAMAAFHSMLDFSLTMPADAFVLAVLLGCASGAPAIGSARGPVNRRRRSRRSASEQRHPSRRGSGSRDREDFEQVGAAFDRRGDHDALPGLVFHGIE